MCMAHEDVTWHSRTLMPSMPSISSARPEDCSRSSSNVLLQGPFYQGSLEKCWVTTNLKALVRQKEAHPSHSPSISSPFSLSTAGSTPKKGSVAEPGRSVVAPGSGVIMCAPVSVCHQVSTIGHRPSPTTCAAHPPGVSAGAELRVAGHTQWLHLQSGKAARMAPFSLQTPSNISQDEGKSSGAACNEPGTRTDCCPA